MNLANARSLVLCAVLAALMRLVCSAASAPAAITIDYPEQGSVFPPDFAAPTFLWREWAEGVNKWLVEVKFGDGSPSIRTESEGKRFEIGPI